MRFLKWIFLLFACVTPCFAQSALLQTTQSQTDSVLGLDVDTSNGNVIVTCDNSIYYGSPITGNAYQTLWTNCGILDSNGSYITAYNVTEDAVAFEWAPPDDRIYTAYSSLDVQIDVAQFVYNAPNYNMYWQESWFDYIYGNTDKNNPPLWVSSAIPFMMVVTYSNTHWWQLQFGAAFNTSRTVDTSASGQPGVLECWLQNWCYNTSTPRCNPTDTTQPISTSVANCFPFYKSTWITERYDDTQPWMCTPLPFYFDTYRLQLVNFVGSVDSTMGKCTEP